MNSIRTITFPLKISEDEKLFINEMRKEQSRVIRSAYNFCKKYDLNEKEIRFELKKRFPQNKEDLIDSWFVQSAIYDAKAMHSADDVLEIKTRIFGGKKNLIRRAKGLISKEEWKEKRLMPLYIVGESPYKGNRKFSFERNKIVFKPFRNKKIEIPLPNLKKKYSKLYLKAVELAEQKKLPITIRLTSKEIHLTFDHGICISEFSKWREPIKNRFCGIDLNPNYIGVTVFDKNHLVSHKLFQLSALTGKPEKGKNQKQNNKLIHETRQIAHNIAHYLKHLRVDKVFVEDLSSLKQQNHQKGRNFNRLINNQWKKNNFFSILEKYFNTISINAAYTSYIGGIVHINLPDPLAASAAIAQRGYRTVILKNKQFYPELPNRKILEERWKQTKDWTFLCWKEFCSLLKIFGVKYRVAIPEGIVFRKFKSTKSKVGVLENEDYGLIALGAV